MNIDIRADTKQFKKKLGLLQRRHIPKATNDAINKTLFGLRKVMIKQLIDKLDRPTPFTQKGFHVRQSMIKNLFGMLFIKDIQAQYLKYQIDGGVRSGNPNVAVPFTKNVKLNKFGNVTGRKSGLIKRNTQFIGEINNVAGVYQRMAKNKLKLLHAFERSVDYQARFPFYKIGLGYVKNKFKRNLKEKYNQEFVKSGKSLI